MSPWITAVRATWSALLRPVENPASARASKTLYMLHQRYLSPRQPGHLDIGRDPQATIDICGPCDRFDADGALLICHPDLSALVFSRIDTHWRVVPFVYRLAKRPPAHYGFPAGSQLMVGDVSGAKRGAHGAKRLAIIGPGWTKGEGTAAPLDAPAFGLAGFPPDAQRQLHAGLVAAVHHVATLARNAPLLSTLRADLYTPGRWVSPFSALDWRDTCANTDRARRAYVQAAAEHVGAARAQVSSARLDATGKPFWPGSAFMDADGRLLYGLAPLMERVMMAAPWSEGGWRRDVAQHWTAPGRSVPQGMHAHIYGRTGAEDAPSAHQRLRVAQILA